MAEPLCSIVSATVSMPTGATQVSYQIPDGAKNGLVIVSSTVGGVAKAFWLSSTAGQVATFGGIPVAAGQSWQWVSPMLGGGITTIYLAHNEGSACTARIQYEIDAARL